VKHAIKVQARNPFRQLHVLQLSLLLPLQPAATTCPLESVHVLWIGTAVGDGSANAQHSTLHEASIGNNQPPALSGEAHSYRLDSAAWAGS